MSKSFSVDFVMTFDTAAVLLLLSPQGRMHEHMHEHMHAHMLA